MTSTLRVNFGGPPSRQTRRDRRLRENAHVAPHADNLAAAPPADQPKITPMPDDGQCPDGMKPGPGGKTCVPDGSAEATASTQPCVDCGEPVFGTEHFAPAVSDAPWKGGASNFTDDQYEKAAAACGPASQGTVKERCVLPHHNPDGTLSRAGLAAAAARSNQLTGPAKALTGDAKAHLRGHYSAIGEDPPPNIAAAIDWHLRSAFDTAAPPESPGPPDTRGVLVVEGQWTGDGRQFAPGSVTWPQPGEAPMVLQWQKETSHGPSMHDVTVAVGIIDRAWRTDDGKIMGEARFDTHPDAVEAQRRNNAGMLQGISINADDIEHADVEHVLPEPSGSADDGDWIDLLFGEPPKTIFHAGRIRAATLCDTPAFVESVFTPVTDGMSIAPPAEPVHAVTQIDRPAVVASSSWDATWRPQRSWFEDPQLVVPTPITITDDGRLFGLVTEWSQCHLGYTGECILPPRHDDFSHYLTGSRPVSDGSQLPVGVVSGGIGHPDIFWSAAKASQHYDNTAAQVAVVRVGNSKLGIWMAGAVVPWASEDNVEGLRSSGQVSPDWRWIGGQLKMVGLLAVTSSGYQTPRVRQFVASGQVRTLIMSGFTSVGHRGEPSEEELNRRAMLLLMRQAAASVAI